MLSDEANAAMACPLLVVPDDSSPTIQVRKWQRHGFKWVRESDDIVPDSTPPSHVSLIESCEDPQAKRLLELAHRYEQCWPVIADHLKAESPSWRDDVHLAVRLREQYAQLTGSGDPFNAQREIQRREAQQAQQQQGGATTGEQQEEAFVARWMARLWMHLPAAVSARTSLLQQHGGTLGTEQRLQGLTLAELAGKPKPQIRPQDPSKPPLTPAQIAANEARRERRREQRRKQAAALAEQRRLERESQSLEVNKTPAAAGRKPSKTLIQPTLRSLALPAIRVGLCRHVDKLMAELGLPPRPNLATAPLIEAYTQLRNALVEFSELQKSLGLGSGSNLSTSQLGSSHERISGIATPRPNPTNVHSQPSPPVTRSIKRKRDSLK